jgi:hypothetical protein
MISDDTKRSLLQFLEGKIGPTDMDDFRRMVDSVDTSTQQTAAMDSKTLRRRVAEATARRSATTAADFARRFPDAGRIRSL